MQQIKEQSEIVYHACNAAKSDLTTLPIDPTSMEKQNATIT
jgi:hypothetical protein